MLDLNATQAAIRAGYSAATAEQQGHRLLRNAGVQDVVSKGAKKAASSAESEIAEVIRELRRIALCDLAEAYKEDGTFKPLHEIPVDVRRAIAGVEVDDLMEDGYKIGHTTKLKFWDKNKSLELLGKYHKLFTDKVEHSGSGPVTINIGGLVKE